MPALATCMPRRGRLVRAAFDAAPAPPTFKLSRVETHKPLKQAVSATSDTVKGLADQRRIKVVERMSETVVGRLTDLGAETAEMKKLVQSRSVNLKKVSDAEKKCRARRTTA